MADVKSLIANMLATGKRPRWDEMPEGDFLPKEALGSALDAEMSYDGSHPRQQEQEAINAFRGYGPQMLMDAFIPGYGAGGDAKAASEAYGEGRYGAAALNAGMAALDFVPVLGALPAAAKGIRAFHGSPHDFDRFDMSKIGTGEGAQAYGRGLYFAENDAVARGYRDALAGNKYDTGFANVDAALNGGAYQGDFARFSRDHPDLAAEIVAAGRDKPTGSAGRMYEVNINADPEAFLDWDKPLSEQGAAVRDAVSGLASRVGFAARETEPPFRPTLEKNPSGRQVVAGFRDATGGNNYSAALRDAGIPGIKYLDAGSRGAGDGSRNYVVFDDRLITILRKYGIGGLIAGGGAYALTDAEYAQAAELLAQDGMNTGAQ